MPVGRAGQGLPGPQSSREGRAARPQQYYVRAPPLPPMRLVSLFIDNLRAASNVLLPLSPLTALVGANGAGKTTIIDALDRFFGGSDMPRGDLGSPTRPVTVTVTFDSAPVIDGEFSVTRTWVPAGGTARARGTTSHDLTGEEQEAVMASVQVTRIPAERTAAGDRTGMGGLGLAGMLREAVAGEAGNPIHAEEQRRRQAYQNLHFSPKLDRFRSEVNKRLRGPSAGSAGYAPDIEALFSLERPEIEPAVRVRFSREGRTYDHAGAGHGAKRAYHMAAIEAHASLSAGAGQTRLLLVDEPELYQHPQRQRRILEAYREISRNGRLQIVYTTHSPFLVDLRSLSGVHKVARNREQEIVVRGCGSVDDGLARLRLSRYIVDGIFADGAILVEGMQDVAVIGAVFSALRTGGVSVAKWLDGRNVSMIHCEGVNDVPHFMRFFRALGVPTFVIWDADSNDADHVNNRRILDLLGARGFTWGKEPGCSGCDIGDGYACFASDCCVYFREELGCDVPDSGLRTADQRRAVQARIKSRIADEMGQAHGIDRRFGGAEFPKSDFATRVVPHILRHFGHP